MYVFKYEKFTLIPLAYNEFCNDIESIRESKKYDGDIQIERVIDAVTLDNILKYCNNEEKTLYVIDMKYIISYEDKVFRNLLQHSNLKIIIVNIADYLIDGISEDLDDKYTLVENNHLCSDSSLEYAFLENYRAISDIYYKENVAIVYWMKKNVTEESIETLEPLDSSGIYCNMYINAKRLFIEPDKYCYIIYQLICMIKSSDEEFDALVSASRNGANIASIIGWLLNKKVIHCTSLGPKFSLAARSINKDIRKNGKYVYIFDFMCLGTEAKMLNALLSFRGASLIGGYGIANYVNLTIGTKYSVLAKVRSLVNVQEEGIGYRVAGTKEEIKEMLMKERFSYVSRLCRV